MIKIVCDYRCGTCDKSTIDNNEEICISCLNPVSNFRNPAPPCGCLDKYYETESGVLQCEGINLYYY